MIRRRALSFAIPSAAALWALSSVPAWSQDRSKLALGTAINRAGKMRALSQRASKAYVQATLNVLPDRAREVMLVTQRLIAHGMSELMAGSPPAELQPLLQALLKDTASLATLTEQPARAESVPQVLRVADNMLASAEQLTRGYEKLSAQQAVRVVNVAGRQRMLSQRAARAYFASAAGKALPDWQLQLDTARKEFNEGLAFMQAAPMSTPHIRSELELTKGQWVFFESALQKTPSPDALQTVATTSERVFDVMDNLTSLYESAVREIMG
jgi:hypothetical protein